MVIRPTAAAPAASDPEMEENIPQTKTVAEPNPPFVQQVRASAISRNLRLKPVRTRTSPVKINNGTAVRAKASIPSNRLSPINESGRASDMTSIRIAAEPMETQTGTAKAHSTTNMITGR